MGQDIFQKITILYDSFFEELKINPDTGILQDYPNLKFATFPYIGSKYGQAKKILVIGLDIGSNENKDKQQSGIISLNKRRKDIEPKDLEKHNPHIAGTYITALKYLRENKEFSSYWKNVEKSKLKSSQAVLKSQDKTLTPINNPLSYIALTNFHKFVTKDREHKLGGQDRKYINKELEIKLLIDEINVFNPKIIIFQGTKFGKDINLINQIRSETKVKEIYCGPHPSYHGRKNPLIYTNQLIEAKKI